MTHDQPDYLASGTDAALTRLLARWTEPYQLTPATMRRVHQAVRASTTDPELEWWQGFSGRLMTVLLQASANVHVQRRFSPMWLLVPPEAAPMTAVGYRPYVRLA